jgi:hypothetical protein
MTVSNDSLTGVIWGPGGVTIGIPKPLGQQISNPRVARADHGWHILFFVSQDTADSRELSGAELWYGRFDKEWVGVRRVLSFPDRLVLPAIAPDVVSRGDDLWFAFPYEQARSQGAPARQGLIEVSRDGGVWHERTVPTLSTPTFVRGVPGWTSHDPLIVGAVHVTRDARGRFHPPGLNLRKGMAPDAIAIDDGSSPVRVPVMARIGSLMIAAWSVSGDRDSYFLAAVDSSGRPLRPIGRLPEKVRGAVSILPVDERTAIIAATAARDSDIVRMWTYDGGRIEAIDSVRFSDPVFKFAAASSAEGSAFLAGALVPASPGARPATEVLAARPRCGR